MIEGEHGSEEVVLQVQLEPQSDALKVSRKRKKIKRKRTVRPKCQVANEAQGCDSRVVALPRDSVLHRGSYAICEGDSGDEVAAGTHSVMISNLSIEAIMDPCVQCPTCRRHFSPHRVGDEKKGGLKKPASSSREGAQERPRVLFSDADAEVVKYQKEEGESVGHEPKAGRSFSTASLATLEALASRGEGGFSCFAHVLLALVGVGRQTHTSLRQATDAYRNRDRCSCFVIVVVIILGHSFIFLLPLAFIFFGLTYVYQKGPRAEDIEDLVKVSSKQPYWMILITSILGAASTALIMGPPALHKPGRTGTLQTISRIGKMGFTLYLLVRTLYTWTEELAELQKIVANEFSRHVGLSTVLRTLMLSMVQSATSSQWSRYADQFVLMLVYNDYLNFRKAHDDDFVGRWGAYMKKIQDAEQSGKLAAESLSSRPYSGNDEEREGEEKGFAPSMLDPGRLILLIQRMKERNGLTSTPPWSKKRDGASGDEQTEQIALGAGRWGRRIWACGHEMGKLIFSVYIVVLLVRCWTFGWGVALVYFPLFTILYPWVTLIVLMFMILMRLLLVDFLMRILIIRQRHKGCRDRVQALCRYCCCLRRGHRKSRDSLKFEACDGKEDEMRLYPSPEEEPTEEDRKKRRKEDHVKLRTIANAMASTGFLPGNFDRALWPQLQCCGKPMPRLPGLLYTNISSEKGSQEELRRNYEHEVAVLQATGITRDGWCYVIIYAAIGKVMVDFMVVVLTRFMAGVGYMDCVVLTLTDRSWQRWMEQFDYMDTINRINRWVNAIW